MARKAGPPQHTLSVSLIKKGISQTAALKSPASLQRFSVADGSTKIGDLYVAPPTPHEPRWTSYVKPYVHGLAKLQNTSTLAVVFIEAAGRLFALTFGYGAALLARDVTEDGFGCASP